MFEQASIDTRGALRSPWALAISITVQTVAVSACILVSLIHTEVIRAPAFLTTLAAPLGPAAPVERTAVRPSKSAPGVFTMPATIPKSIDLTVHDTALASAPDISIEGGGIPGGIERAPGSYPGLIDSIARPAPPAPRTEPPPAKKADVVAPRKPLAVSTGVQAAKLIRQVNPAYPQLARSARISGTVRLVAIIGKDGAIENLRVIGGHPLLTTAAVDAVKQWRYQPTLLNNEPVEVITQIDVNFTLSQ